MDEPTYDVDGDPDDDDSEDEAVKEDSAFWYGVTLARRGKSKAAIVALQSFITKYPRSRRRGEASTVLGRLLLEKGDKAGAAERYRDAATDASPEVRAAAKAGLDRAAGK